MTRLMTLIALLLMPFAMASAPAASPWGAHHQSAGTPAEHCPDQAPETGTDAAYAGCAMPCASALPAADWPVIAAGFVAGAAEPAIASSLSGILLEIATPPPRRS